MSDAKNIIMCGHPVGTLIEVAIKNGKYSVKERKQIPIEELKQGDYISSYNFSDSAVYTKELTSCTLQHYSGKLFNIEVNDSRIACMPTHKCLVRYRDISRDYCVYVMRKGTAFRVGMSKIWHNDNGCGPYKRLLDEGGDELWILQTFADRRDALLEECKVSIKFRLPQAMFKFKESRGSWTQSEFDYVWSEVSNKEDAEAALTYYGRDINYPYFNRSKKHTSIKRPHTVLACNLLDNSEMMTRDKQWVNIKHSIENYTGDIVALSFDSNETYYSNNILTSS